MKTGKQTVTIDGESFTFKFKTGSNLKGSGLVGEDDDKLYMAGKQVKADKDDKYTVYKYDKTNNLSLIHIWSRRQAVGRLRRFKKRLQKHSQAFAAAFFIHSHHVTISSIIARCSFEDRVK